VRAIRALWRHRDALVRQSSWQVQHVHKAIDQMNVQIHHVIADITGATGTAIVEAILAGQRDPVHLAGLRDNRISGGKTLSVATRATANRVAHALRVAAQGVGHAHNEIGGFHRRMRARLGGAAAVTATAHKLARILYACLRDKSTYDPSRHDLNSPLRRAKTLAKIRARALNLGFQLIELQPAS
jgi:hypothetical protein